MCGIVKLSSVRGRKRLFGSSIAVRAIGLQFIPARGRKQPAHDRYNVEHLIAIYPRKGTETCKMFRGTYAYANIAIYPRKGTETSGPCRYYATARLQFIPVRGRKLVRPAVNRCNVGTIPVRGRKLTTHGANAQTATLQFIPARGRKLHVQVKHAHLFHNCNLSPQGDKKAPLPLAFASSGGALLFPIFYFTGWELRLTGSSL